jgi:hypothetical protein
VSTACFAASVLVPTLVSYHPFGGRVSLLLLVEQPPHLGVAQVNSNRTVHKPVDYHVGLHAAAELAVPVGG